MPSVTYPVACELLGFDAGSVLRAAQAGDTQMLRGTRITYLGLGQFRLEAPPGSLPTLPRQAHQAIKVRREARAPFGERRGRHAAPSQTGRVATTAVRVAPAFAVAGALAVVPQAAHAPVKAPAPYPVTRMLTTVHTTTKTTPAYHTYTVRPGDTLSKIAQRVWGHYGYWINLYMENQKVVGSDPNLIYAGQVLKIPDQPAHLTAAEQSSALTAASARPVTHQSSQGENENDGGSDGPGDDGSSHATQSGGENENDGGSGAGEDSGSQAATQSSSQAASTTSLGGTLGCSGLKQLWDQAGGNPSNATMAADIAMAESSGQQDPPSNASSNSNGMTDVGYWQINSGFWPSLATTDPIGNAKAAIQISNDGANWGPWVTYQTGAYQNSGC